MSGCRDWPGSARQASFKGISFEVQEDSDEGGRRLAIHEYPSSDSWDVEDTGRAKVMIRVQAYVVGDDADLQAVTLKAACGAEGMGLLVLPHRPAQMAYCQNISTSFSQDAQGRFPVQMEFVALAAGLPLGPSLAFFAGAVDIAVRAALGKAEAAFSAAFDTILKRFSPAQYVPAAARDAAAQTIITAAGLLDAARIACRMEAAANAEVGFAIQRLIADAALLAYQGQRPDVIDAEVFVAEAATIDNGFAGRFSAAALALATAARDASELADAMQPLTVFEAQSFVGPASAFSLRAERGLTAEVASLTRRLGLLLWALALSRRRFGLRAEAIRNRYALAQAFAAESDRINDAGLAAEMANALAKTMACLSAQAKQAPSTITLSTRVATPAVVLAARLYDDPARAAELVSRNAGDWLYMPTALTGAAP